MIFADGHCPVSAFNIFNEKVVYPRIKDLVNEPLVPTYTFVSFYQRDSQLLRHRDKEECGITLNYIIKCDRPWQLHFEEGSSFNTNQSDLLDLDHWRDPYQGETFWNILFHFKFAESIDS